MAKLIPPMFARLYISMVLALSASIFLTLQFSNGYLERDAIEDFVKDTNYSYQLFEKKLAQRGGSVTDYFETVSLAYSHFDLRWLEEWNELAVCDDCEQIAQFGDVRVFENDEDGMFSVYPVAGSSGALIISDRPSLNIEDDLMTVAWYQDPENMVPFSLLLVSLIVIGVMLYYPVRELQNQIDSLVRINRLFGQGDLQVRADEKIPQPLNELATNFNTMAREISDTVDESHVFAQAVPHEMRTPLSRIQLATGLLRKRCSQGIEQELLNDIELYIDDLDNLTTQVITYSRLNSNYIKTDVGQVTSIVLSEFISSRIEFYKKTTNVKVQFNTEPSSNLIANPVHLRLLFDNLMKNALQYASSEVIITLSAEKGFQLMTVENDGARIAPEHRQLIFVPFARLDKSRNSKTGGLGLGLAIAKAATKRLGGSLTVHDGQNGGAKFVVSIKSVKT